MKSVRTKIARNLRKSASVFLASGAVLTAADLCYGQTTFTHVDGGWRHTCATVAGGGLKCWGHNGYGQLGDGTTTNKSVPNNVSGLGSGISEIAANGYFTCAIDAGGGVKCWGYNEFLQLGDGTTTNRIVPTNVSGLGSGVAAIATGVYHTCAIVPGGGVKCWGQNEDGQLGDGTTTVRTVPTDVSGLGSGVTAIAAAGGHTCAIVAGGGVKCWGYNNHGQLGDGTTTARTVPTDVSGLGSGVTAIATGVYHTCAIVAEGGAKCWGENSYGQLGDGSFTDKSVPTSVSGLESDVTAIAAGRHTCAIVRGGAKCWGRNNYGQLGDSSTTDKSVPASVSGLESGVTAIATGERHTCATTTGGRLKCWGDNGYGQLGDCTTTLRLTPVNVLLACTGCGDGVIDFGEACDQWNLNSRTCATEGSGWTGTLSCDDNCTFNTSGCVGCGNGRIDVGEDCDQTNINDETCATAIDASWLGTLSCNNDCTFNTTQCTQCGNGVINGTEQCDLTNLNSKTCADAAGPGWLGTLSCNNDCTFNTTQCTQCGNGNIDGTEDCDLANLNSKTCTTELGDDYIGTLTCNTDCTFNTTACVLSSCGNESVDNREECDGTNLGGWTCQILGFEGGELRCSNSCRLDKTNCYGDAGVDDPEPDGGSDAGLDGNVNGHPDGDSESGIEPTEFRGDQTENDSGCSCRTAPRGDKSPIRNALALIAALCTTIAFRIRRRSCKEALKTASCESVISLNPRIGETSENCNGQ